MITTSPWSGTPALLYSIRALEKLRVGNDDQKVGVEIVRRALQSPVRQIAENAGFDGAVVAGKMLDQKDTNYGFDAQKGEYVDMVKAGIANIVAKTGRTHEQVLSEITARNPQKRLIKPEEVAHVVAWLCLPGTGMCGTGWCWSNQTTCARVRDARPRTTSS